MLVSSSLASDLGVNKAATVPYGTFMIKLVVSGAFPGNTQPSVRVTTYGWYLVINSSFDRRILQCSLQMFYKRRLLIPATPLLAADSDG